LTTAASATLWAVGYDRMEIDVLAALPEVANPCRQACIRKTLPIYIFRGSRHPVGISIDQLLEAYQLAGLQEVTYKLYPEGRHETLNDQPRRSDARPDRVAQWHPAKRRSETRSGFRVGQEHDDRMCFGPIGKVWDRR
jgi:alpha-beta hydrolase superfamily lysophospholipase